MESRSIVIIVIGVASYLGGVLQGLTTVGDAIFLHILWRSFAIVFPDIARSTPLGDHDLELITLILVVRALVVLPVFLWQCRHDFRLGLIQYVLPGQIVFIILGAIFLHNNATDPRLRIALGILFLTFGIVCLLQKIYVKVIMKQKQAPTPANVEPPPTVPLPMVVVTSSSGTDERPNFETVTTTGENVTENGEDAASPKIPYAPPATTPMVPHCPKDAAWSKVSRECQIAFAIVGPISGFLAGVSGIGGPPIFVLLFYFELPATVVRGTLPLCWYSILLMRSVVSLWQGDFRLDCWPEYLAAITGGIFGTTFGNVFGAKVTTTVFVSTIFVLLVMASLSMMDISPWITMGIGAVLAALIRFWVVPHELL